MELEVKGMEELQSYFKIDIEQLMKDQMQKFAEANRSLFNDQTSQIQGNILLHECDTTLGKLTLFMRFELVWDGKAAWQSGVLKTILFDKEPDWIRSDRMAAGSHVNLGEIGQN